MLRQLLRCIKYYNRGYNTDLLALKYIEIIDNLIQYDSPFRGDMTNAKISVIQEDLKIVKDIFEAWIKDHKITEEELLILEQKIYENN